jgi:YidC/Oxa1 family membrane protein insertase
MALLSQTVNRKRKRAIIGALLLVVLLLAGCTPNTIDTIQTEDLLEGGFFQRYFVYPMSWALNLFADLLFGEYGLSILVMTILVRLIVLPLNIKQYKSTKAMQKIQPELQALQKKYKNDQQKLQEETMKLFQKHNVNPLSGCFPLLVQMPILIALYYAIMYNPDIRTHSFLWMNLGEKDPYYILPILAALTTWVQQKVMSMFTPPNPQMRMIMLIFPVMIFTISMGLPAALPLYWVYGNIFMIVQTYFMYGRGSKEEGGSAKK